jgi:hypothetical protein
MNMVRTVCVANHLIKRHKVDIQEDVINRIASGPLALLLRAMFMESKGDLKQAEQYYRACPEECQPYAALYLAKMLSRTAFSPDELLPICEELLATANCAETQEWVVLAVKRMTYKHDHLVFWLRCLSELSLPPVSKSRLQGWLNHKLTIELRRMGKTLLKRQRELEDASKKMEDLEEEVVTAPVKKQKSQVASRVSTLKFAIQDLGEKISAFKRERELPRCSESRKLRVKATGGKAPVEDESTEDESTEDESTDEEPQ